ncbi:MAG: hypothetical protein HYZ14_10590 [Bacteroidetes bacterium]|nr:hypothetical protein [Bacteroidota bacterium]
MKNNLLPVLVIPSLFLACTGEGGGTLFGGTALPENPEKIVIEWNEGGGMLPEGETIYLSTDSSYYYMWKDQTRQKLYFNTSEQELNEIYQVCRDNNFDKIRLIEEQEVYDRGGTSIRLIADGKYIDKNNSGMTFLHESDVDEYYAVETKIYSFAMHKIESMKTKTTLKIGRELLDKNYLIYISINGYNIYNSDSGDSLLTHLDTMLYTAPNEFALNLYAKDSLDSYGSPAFLKATSRVKEISDTSNTVTFGLDKTGTPVVN